MQLSHQKMINHLSGLPEYQHCSLLSSQDTIQNSFLLSKIRFKVIYCSVTTFTDPLICVFCVSLSSTVHLWQRLLLLLTYNLNCSLSLPPYPLSFPLLFVPLLSFSPSPCEFLTGSDLLFMPHWFSLLGK